MDKKTDKKATDKKAMDKLTIEEGIEKGGLFCRIIVEVLGKPKNYVLEAADLLVEKAEKDEHFTIMKMEKHPATDVQDGFFSTYIEFELLFKNFMGLIDFCFEYMPSSIEIMEPEERRYHMHEMNTMFNELMAKLHNADMIAKGMKAQAEKMDRNIGQLLSIILMLSLRDGPKTLEELAAFTKISGESLKPMLDSALKVKRIMLTKENRYTLAY